MTRWKSVGSTGRLSSSLCSLGPRFRRATGEGPVYSRTAPAAWSVPVWVSSEESAVSDDPQAWHVAERLDPDQVVRQVTATYERVAAEVHKVIVGQDRVLDELLVALLCGGHVLVVGVPGLAKTLLISTIAGTLSLRFARIQFTPDLMPSDMTGTEVIEEDRSTGSRRLRFVPGPVFANVLLADEINRTPPKTQAALLEAMQERHVTAGGVQHELPRPFFVLATQNPIEQEGTYPLPEAQLDRFMFNTLIDYPTEEQEVEIVRRTTSTEQPSVQPVLAAEEVLRLQGLVRCVPVADHVVRQALRLARMTRGGGGDDQPEIVRKYLAWGAGPRASQYLILAAKARAILSGSSHVMPEHVRSVALPVLRHRIILNFNAEADGISADRIINELLARLPLEDGNRATAARLDATMRKPDRS
jgi:MoxR-like ATPase